MTYTVIAPERPGPGSGPHQRPQAGPGFGPRPGPGQFRPGPPPAPQRPGVSVDQQVVRVLFAGLGLIGVALGVSLPGPAGAGWSAFTAWSIFGTLCGLAGLIAAALTNSTLSWQLLLCAAAGAVLFWLIAVRPIAISDVGFLATIGVVATCVATWLHPRRPRGRQPAFGRR